MKRGDVYLGTVLLEANRWAAQRSPGFRVSDWLARADGAGFDGVELWENHAVLADARERAALRAAPLPVSVFNSYVPFDEAGAPARAATATMVRDLGARAVKFNVGNDPARLAGELAEARRWGEQMPDVRLLCECHSGTSLEDPATAAAALAGFPDIDIIVHPFSGAHLPDWLARFGGRVRHAHVQVVDAQWRRWRLRDQPVLVRERLAMLRDAGFDGSFTIEFTAGVGAVTEDRDALFAAACEDLVFLKEEWSQR